MATIESFTEAIILSLVFVAVLTIVVAEFNLSYNKNEQLPFSDSSGAEQLFIKYQDTAQEQIGGGDVEFDSSTGITLKSSWGLVKDVTSIVWGFISGGWIEQIVNSWNIGESGTLLAKGLRILYFISLVFAILYALFKVVT